MAPDWALLQIPEVRDSDKEAVLFTRLSNITIGARNATR